MIITKQKRIDDILDFIESESVFLIGCSECATVCKTGGEDEILEIKDILEKNMIEVTGWTILEPACNLLNDKRILKQYKNVLEKTKKILVFACGNGVQTVSEILVDFDVFSGTDTLFLGEVKRIGDFEKRCNLCGECIQSEFAGFCPVSRCPKKMLNGPCGGSVNGKCEIDSNLDCVWTLIYQKLKNKNQMGFLKTIVEPKDWSKSLETKWRKQ